MKDTSTGTHFWYADRRSHMPIECEILDKNFGHPQSIIARVLSTGEVFRCFPDFGCYDLRSYSHALRDAEKIDERIIK